MRAPRQPEPDPADGKGQDASLVAPDVGAALRRLRQRRGMSLNALAVASGISRSFLASVERGDSDISVGRLTQVAHALGKDVASLLGFADRYPGPEYVRAHEQYSASRGKGVDFTVTRVPHTNIEFLLVTLEPHTSSDETLSQPGLDILYVVDGELVLVYDGDDYPVRALECIVWPSSRPRTTIRNDTDRVARAIGFSTEIAY
jgi:transcriptional regulator with XRE-family HTH domain